jgi:hypothetical protein
VGTVIFMVWIRVVTKKGTQRHVGDGISTQVTGQNCLSIMQWKLCI